MHADSLLQALIIVCRHYQLPASPDSVLAGLPLKHGILPSHLFVQAANNAGLDATDCAFTVAQFTPMLLPLVAQLADQHACVILAVDSEHKQLLISPTPALPSQAQASIAKASQDNDDAYWVSFSAFDEQFQQRVFLLKPQFQFDDRSKEPHEKNERNAAKNHWFWHTLWQSKGIYQDVLIASILINLFAVATPLFTRLVYDKVVPNQAFDSLWVLVSGMAIIFGFDLLLKGLRSHFLDIAGKKADLLMSSAIYRKVMAIKLAAKPPSVGAFARHLQEFESIRDLFTSATVAALIDLPFALLFLAVIAAIAGPLVWVPVIAMVLLALFSWLIQRPLRASIEQGSKLSSQKHANLIESLAGLETVRQQGAQHRFQYQWEQAIAHMANWGVKSRRLTDALNHWSGFTQQTVTVAVIVVGVYLIAAGQLTVGGLIAVSMLTSRAIAPMVQLAQLSTRYQQATSAYAIINDIMAMPEEVTPNRHYLDKPDLTGAMACEEVHFAYPTASMSLSSGTASPRPVLNGITLSIAAGEKVAIIGKIGAGKSTLQRLLCGLYSPSNGAVRFDHTDIHQLHPLALRRQIGCMPQDITLFYGSIRDNITLGHPQATDASIWQACEQAGVTRFTQQAPDGLDRQVGEGGLQLSGGQRQAIGLARALLRQPKILILDEPTSQMDNAAELHVKKHLMRLDDTHTVVLFTHKTSLLDAVSRIIVIDNGTVVLDGEKNRVLAQLKHT
ncbi:type I secretion system permease/ATPase [Photobacterium aphoticum]|uniref:ABC transporter n=1 Tax=Photobacterium aphoticum TaxID=754436 RepID=A0A0J1JH84_9GAMM|nr:type I secretion system permease/ATPase [Photobacterium aphoticum]KLV01287.1 ABC transporter [Photobacterium aphoticum]PSU57048.1 type I secretion system permease/ATPase [Photobacterium aphoticum]